MSVANRQKPNNALNLMGELGHVSKEEVKAMKEYPGVSILLKEERVGRAVRCYNFGAEVLAAIETVIVKSAYNTIREQEKTRMPSKKLQRKLHLYLQDEIKKMCKDSAQIGPAAMIYAINSLDEAVGGKHTVTLELLKLMGEKESKAGLVGVIFLTHGIVERLRTIKSYEDPVEVIKEFLYEKSEFMANVRSISSIR